MMIAELLFTHDKLLSLHLGDTKMDHDGVIGILSVLNSSNYTLEELNLDNPTFGQRAVVCTSLSVHVGRMLQNNGGL